MAICTNPTVAQGPKIATASMGDCGKIGGCSSGTDFGARPHGSGVGVLTNNYIKKAKNSRNDTLIFIHSFKRENAFSDIFLIKFVFLLGHKISQKKVVVLRRGSLSTRQNHLL